MYFSYTPVHGMEGSTQCPDIFFPLPLASPPDTGKIRLAHRTIPMEFKFYWYKHVTIDACPLCGHLLPSASLKWLAFRLQHLSLIMTQLPSWKLTQNQTSSCCREWQTLHLHPAILSPNLACYTGRSCTTTSRSTCAKLTSLVWHFKTEIGSAHLPGCHLPGKFSVERP